MAEPMKIMYAISKCPRYILPRADSREPGNLMTVLKTDEGPVQIEEAGSLGQGIFLWKENSEGCT